MELIEDAGITPNKIAIFVPGENEFRRRTLSKRTTLLDIISPFTNYNSIAFDEPINGNFLNVKSHMSVSLERNRYIIAKFRSHFNTNDVIQNIRAACKYVTPRYGFSHSEIGPLALAFPAGVGITRIDRDTLKRIDSLGHSLRRTNEHLAGKLHDVYGVNVLSPLHLERQVEGQSLRDWIGAGARGDLLTIKDEVFAWIVPDSVRPAVRATLFSEGALIATV